MASRLLETSAAQAVLAFVGLALGSAAIAADKPVVDTPRYSYLGFNYESTETKEGVDPADDPVFNSGDFSLITVQGALGITPWFHLHGEYFDGDCNRCESVTYDNPAPPPSTITSVSDRSFDGFKIGGGINYALDFIGLDNVDAVLRAHYLEISLEGVDDQDGYTVDTLVRAQISDRAEVWAGTEYQNIQDIENMDVVIGLGYELWNGLTLTGSGIIFNNESGFDIGLRWYFGEALMQRDYLFK
jgi:hypothetical protein